MSTVCSTATKKPVYSSAQQPGTKWPLTQTKDIDVAGQNWTLEIVLDVASTQSNGLVLVLVLVFFGFAFSILLSHALYQTSKTRHFQKRLEAIVDQMVDGLVTIDTDSFIRSSMPPVKKSSAIPRPRSSARR